jgi:hypothetical protein
VITDSSQELQPEPVHKVQPDPAQQKPRPPEEHHSEIINVEESPPPPRRRAAAAPNARPALAAPSRIEHFFKKSRA